MDTGDSTPQPQGRPPRPVLAWIWPIITHALLLGCIGFWIWGLMVPFHEPHLQIIGSGWWQYGALAVGWLLYALMGFSAKVSALITRRMPRVLWLPSKTLLEFNLEAPGLALFLGYGLLPLTIHPSNPVWIGEFLIWCYGALAIGALITMIKPIRRRLTAALGSTGSNGQSLVSQPMYLSRRAFLSGGVALGMGAAGLVAFWRALPALIPDYTFFGHSSDITSLSWFPDSRRIASTSEHGQFLIWNAADGSNQRTLAPIASYSTKIQVSPNGALIAAGDYSSLSVVDAVTGSVLWKKDTDGSFSWAPDSAHLVMLSDSDDKVYITVRDAFTGAETNTTFVLSGDVSHLQSVAWSPDGKSIAVTDGAQIVRWDAASGVQGETFNLPVATRERVRDFAWSPDGRSLAVALERVAYVWSLDNAAAPIVYREFSGDVYSILLSWSPDGRYIASAGDEDRTVRVWEASTGKTVFVYNGHFSFLQAVAWSPDGRRIASGGFDHLVHVWHPALPA